MHPCRPPAQMPPTETAAWPEPLIAGTLELLTFYARNPTLAAADQIASHLARLARHPGVSDTMQGLCTRLFLDWLGPADIQDTGPEHHWKNVHERAALLQ